MKKYYKYYIIQTILFITINLLILNILDIATSNYKKILLLMPTSLLFILALKLADAKKENEERENKRK